MAANDEGVRIGNAEREAATKALDEHLAAGRIDMDEYGERYAQASMARTRGELEPLFADLPEPHALSLLAGSASARPAVSLTKPEPARRQRNPWQLMPLFVPLAIILTIAFSWGWMAWIVVPAMMGVVGGGSHGRGRDWDAGRQGRRGQSCGSGRW